ncbi:MAG: winged helix-turn-helix transcriptional regulator [Anaerolineales bacterium]|nr:winged helix-turn-helix transcriptional regulator [Anaerolineales bacterium]
MLPTFSALAEPNRLRIIELLREGPRPVGEIAARLRLRQPQVSKHLRVLSAAGLVEVHPAAQQRIYQLRAAQFQALDDWLAAYRQFKEASYDRLEEHLNVLQAMEKQDGRPD